MVRTSTEAPLDVLIIGAGLSGIAAAYHLQTQLPGKSYAILEARNAIGGTWDLFRYPGIRSDSDMFTLGFRFKPWRDGKAIADGASIREYIEETARENGIDRQIRFGQRVVAAEWSSATARWTVRTERASFVCRFLYVCTGYYDYAGGHAPTWPGMERFGGQIVHPQKWPEGLDLAGKRVVVIGSGATAVTLVPAMAETAAHVTMLQRSPTYIATLPATDALADWLRGRLPEKLAHGILRWKNVARAMFYYELARKQPGLFRRALAKQVAEAVGESYEARHFEPKYAPWDERLCIVPDGDLFQALRAGRAAIVTDTISAFTEQGLKLSSGQELPADIVVTATGLRLQLMGGAALSVDGAPVNLADVVTYKGMMWSGVPNLASIFGYTNASWTLKCELIAEHVCRLLRYMDRHGYTQVTPRAPAGMVTAPLIDLRSGYVRRAAPALPRQGERVPWRVYQNYVRDLFLFRHARVDDPALEFSPRRGARMQLAERTAVVTGAGSGIGRALAELLAERGCHLALADIDETSVAATAAAVARPGLRVSFHKLDVADPAAVAAFPDVVAAHHPTVDLLFNNAGVAIGGTFEQVSEEDFDWLFSINFHGVVRMTRAFLPRLRQSDDARIVNLSSLFGLIAPPEQTAYSASKFAVRGFSESLRHELAGSSVGVTVVHPGGVATAIADRARVPQGATPAMVEYRRSLAKKMLRMPPPKAAAIIVEGVERRKPRVIVGNDALALSVLERLLPVGYWQLLENFVPGLRAAR